MYRFKDIKNVIHANREPFEKVMFIDYFKDKIAKKLLELLNYNNQ